MKLTKITGLIIFIAGIHLAGCDSESFSVFLWSKIIAVSLFGVSILLMSIIKQDE